MKTVKKLRKACVGDKREDFCVSKNMGKPPNHPFVHRVFHYI